MRSLLPTTRSLRLAVLLGERSSFALALLFRTTLAAANQLLPSPRYRVEFISARGNRSESAHGVTIDTRRPGPCDYLVIPPFDGVEPQWSPEFVDVDLVRRAYARGSTIASACLGSLALAAAGILDQREATTHWSWGQEARRRYPQVHWDTRRILIDQQQIVTAGGYLAAVDLALHIIAKTSSRDIAHRVGRRVLADSTRQYQSIYAQQLVEPAAAGDRFAALDRWIGQQLRQSPSAADMAKRCGMSVRSFHRQFVRDRGVTPRKFLQLKRIETVRGLLGGALSLERILEQVGVSDPTSFRRVFQRELGVSLAEYRRRVRGPVP